MNPNLDHHPDARPRLVAVRFEFAHPKAIAVAVAGSFNDWHPTTRAMHPAGGGYWLKDTVLSPGIYEYCLVVDGQWLPDPCVRETVPNPFGGRNSVLNVAG
jgi:1,4-alpha-glucan branching enzyme